MSDIFGLEAHDYSHFEAIKKHFDEEGLLQHLRDREVQSGFPAHDFDALGALRGRLNLNDAETNAQSIRIATNSQEALQSMVDEVLYTEFRGYEWTPINTNIPDGADSYAFQIVDKFGQGRFIETSGGDAPNATATRRKVSNSMHYAGILPEWAVEDARRAAFGGVPLDREIMDAASRGVMDHIESVILRGEPTLGFKGLINHGDVTAETAAATFAASTPQVIVDLLQAKITDVITRTNEVFGRTVKSQMAIYMPVAQAAHVTQTRYNEYSDKSIWTYVQENNSWRTYAKQGIQLHWVQELNNAGPANADRMIIGFNDSYVMEMGMSIPPRIMSAYERPYVICFPMEYKISPLWIKRPAVMRYIDGI